MARGVISSLIDSSYCLFYASIQSSLAGARARALATLRGLWLLIPVSNTSGSQAGSHSEAGGGGGGPPRWGAWNVFFYPWITARPAIISWSRTVSAGPEREQFGHAQRPGSFPGRKLKFDRDLEAKSRVGEHLYHRITLRELDADDVQVPSGRVEAKQQGKEKEEEGQVLDRRWK